MGTAAHPRGTSNGNERGSSYTRRERKIWMIETYRADTDAIQRIYEDGSVVVSGSPFTDMKGVPDIEAGLAYWLRAMERQDQHGGMVLLKSLAPAQRIVEVTAEPACRCYRCGKLLTLATLTVDRIKPGILGGLYRTVRRDKKEGVTNVRPACGGCNSKTGGPLANGKEHQAAKARAARSRTPAIVETVRVVE